MWLYHFNTFGEKGDPSIDVFCMLLELPSFRFIVLRNSHAGSSALHRLLTALFVLLPHMLPSPSSKLGEAVSNVNKMVFTSQTHLLLLYL